MANTIGTAGGFSSQLNMSQPHANEALTMINTRASQNSSLIYELASVNRSKGSMHSSRNVTLKDRLANGVMHQSSKYPHINAAINNCILNTANAQENDNLMIAEHLVYLMNKNEETQTQKQMPNLIPKKNQNVQLRSINETRTPMNARTRDLTRKIALSQVKVQPLEKFQ